MTNSGAQERESSVYASERVRIDKWLWAARFFKTRSLAADAVESAKVLLSGARIKPARALKLGDELEIRTPGALYVVRVKLLSEKRGPAAQAALLYEETEQSKQARAQARQDHTAHPDAYIKGRPTKRVRRVLHKVRGQLY
jgi:ribosome-associated heat shock protein Hsp15